jgi:hypothetical protein
LITQKTILIAVVIIAGIVATAGITFLTVILSIIYETCREKFRRHRQKHRFELIPTYHNVRALRSLNINVESYADEDYPTPPPSAPLPDFEFDTNAVRKEAVITFEDGPAQR